MLLLLIVMSRDVHRLLLTGMNIARRIAADSRGRTAGLFRQMTPDLEEITADITADITGSIIKLTGGNHES